MSTVPCGRCGTPLSALNAGVCPLCAGRLALESRDGAGERAPVAGQAVRVGDYELLEELGRGAMGLVFRARQISLKREVALKIILSGQFASEADRKRFLIEAELAATLDHPNIVTVFEVGDAGGRSFIAMKWVHGGHLGAALAEGSGRDAGDGAAPPGPPGCSRDVWVASLLAKAARAVHHAHLRGIIHRDLKPANILVDTAGEPYVSDFGLARRLGEDSLLTLTGSPVGTPAYMSPEQARGERTLTTGTDVWSLGVILYELLAGYPPFQAEHVPAVLRKIVEDEPAPLPVARATRNQWRQLPCPDPDLATICLKCLEKDPVRRYASAADLAGDLERWLRREPIQARPTGWWVRVQKWTQRNPGLATLSLVMMLVAALGVGGVLWQWHRADRNAANARAAQESAEQAGKDLLHLVNRLAQEKAEGLFQQGDASAAVSLLAALLRRSPSNAAAGERLLSALSGRPFAVPLRMLAEVDASILSHPGGNGGAGWIAGLYDQREARLYDTATGRPVSPVFQSHGRHAPPCFSPDGHWVALVQNPSAVEIRQSLTAELVAGPLAMTSASPVTVLRFTVDGRAAFAGTAVGEWRAWLVNQPRQMGKLASTGVPLIDADLSSEPHRWAVIQADGRVQVLDSDGVSADHEFRPTSMPRQVRWSRDGLILALVLGDDRIECREAVSNRIVAAWTFPERIISVTAGSDPPLWSVQGQTMMWVWSSASGRPLNEPILRRAQGALLTLPSGQRQFEAVTENGRIGVFRLRSFLAPDLAAPGSNTFLIRFSARGSHLVTGGRDGRVREWTLPGLEPAGHEVPLPGRLLDLDLDGRRALVVSNLDVRVVDCRTGGDVSPPLRVPAPVKQGALSARDHFWAVANDGAQIYTWRERGGAIVFQHPYQIRGMDLSRDGRWLVARWGQYVSLYPDRTNEVLNLENRGFVTDFQVSSNGRWLVTGTLGYRATLWSLDSRQKVREFEHDGPVTAVALNNEARRLATLATVRGSRAFLWDAQNGERLGPALAQAGSITCLAFSQDGQRLATGGEDGSIRIWDAQSGLPVSELLPHRVAIESLRFHPDRSCLAALDREGGVVVWRLPRVAGRAPDWLAPVAEALGGRQRTAGDSERLTPWGEALAALEALQKAAPVDPLASWLWERLLGSGTPRTL